jgi:mannosyltransferase
MTTPADGRRAPSTTSRRVVAAGTAVAVAVGVVLRFWSSGPLWLDEALTVNIAALRVGDIPGALERDGLPPLFYVLLHGWMAAVGDGDTAVRALSGVISTATLPLAYLAGRRLGGHRVGLLALVVLALNPFALRYATETRMYSLVMFLVMAGFLLVHRAMQDPPRLATLAGIAAVTAALAYTHYWTFWLIGATAAMAALAAWRATGDRRRAPLGVLGAIVAGGLAFLPWLPTFLRQAAHTATPWAAPSRPTSALATTLTGLGGGEIPEGTFLGVAVLGGFALLGVLGRPRGPRLVELVLERVPGSVPRVVALVVVLTMAFGTTAAVASGNAFATRYASVVVPLILLLAASGLSHIESPPLLGGLLALVAVLGVGAALQQATDHRTQAGEVAAAIMAGTPDDGSFGPAPVVLYCPDQLGPAVHRLLPDDTFDQVVFPELEPPAVEAPARIDWFDYQDRQEAIAPGDVARAVIERAGERNAIWVVFHPGYRTPGDRCTDLVDELGALRAGRGVVVADGGRYFEPANLVVHPPVGS